MRGICIVLCLVSATTATLFQDCGSVGSDIEFNVDGCEFPPCVLKRGSSTPVNLKFTSSEASESLTLAITGNIGGVNLPWPGLDTDGCKQLEGTSTPCPFEGGVRVDWSMDIDVLAEYPKITTVVTFKLSDDTGATQACVVVPVTLE